MDIGVEQANGSAYLEYVLNHQLGARADGLDEVDALLRWSEGALDLHWRTGQSKPLSLGLDFLAQAKCLRSFPAPKQGAFNQALGKRSKTILDLSGGFGGDSLLMSLQGYKVTVVERLALMAVLIKDAFERLAQKDWLGREQWQMPNVVNQEARQFLTSTSSLPYDCVYFDPMFPNKAKRSAASNKYMRFLQALAGPDQDSSAVAQAVMSAGCARLVVKRPNYATPLIEPIAEQFSSKLVHYDVYLASDYSRAAVS